MIEWQVAGPRGLDLLAMDEEYERGERERVAKVAACGEHDWHIELHAPDDEDDPAGVHLYCTRCPAGIDDVYPDYHDLMGGEVAPGVWVADGKHDSPVALDVPVTVDLWGSKSWTDYGWDYDAGVELYMREVTDA
jgi:hypothetical protein